MDFIITESQLKIISEGSQSRSKLSQNMKELYSFTSNLVTKINKNFGLNIKMLLTWGTAVGAMMKPLSIWIETGSFDIDEDQKNLLLAAVSLILFYENKRLVSKMISKIKEEGLTEAFEIILSKGKELKKTFLDFVESLALSMVSLIDILSYAFLIPILTDIQALASSSKDIIQTTELIVERLMASGVLVVSSAILTSIIRKIVLRFK